jgi:hypothetical protein
MCAGRQVLTPRRLITHREPGHRELSRERGAGGQSQCLEHLLYELGSESIPVRLFRLREAYSSSRAVLSSCKGGVNDFAMRVLRNVKLNLQGSPNILGFEFRPSCVPLIEQALRLFHGWHSFL